MNNSELRDRKSFYEILEEMHKDLDKLLMYTTNRENPKGRSMKGRTPKQVFITGIKKSGEGGSAI